MPLIDEVVNYKVAYYPFGSPHRGYITLYGTDGILGSARFYDDPSEITSAVEVSRGRYHLYYRTEDFPQVIDLLRNEKPIYLYYYTSYAKLSSTTEPVGEDEPE